MIDFDTNKPYILTFIPLAMWDEEDQQWYPSVKVMRNGDEFVRHTQFIMGFDDEATATVFARDFAKDERAMFEHIASRMLKSDRGMK